MERQISIIYAGTRGFLDKYPVDVLQEYEQQFYSFMESKHEELFMELREKKEISEDFDNRMKAALTEFDSAFQPTTGEAL
jgi:F-type H+-transporting ATPase subunit alpha